MSKVVFQYITFSINFYEEIITKINKLKIELCLNKEDNDIFYDIHIKEYKLKIILLKKIIYLVGNIDDKIYHKFFNSHIKDYKFKLIIFKNFRNIYNFIDIIKDCYNNDLYNEINNLLYNIYIISHPPSHKSIEPIHPLLPIIKFQNLPVLQIELWKKIFHNL
jgi:hypothetical protein